MRMKNPQYFKFLLVSASLLSKPPDKYFRHSPGLCLRKTWNGDDNTGVFTL